jgi:hypothetical protein
MPKAISETTLVTEYGAPNISYGKKTGLLNYKPLLTFQIGDGMHISIIPDDSWCMNQMGYESSEDFDDANPLHTTVDGITFDEFHVTANEGGSTFVTIAGNVTLSDGPARTKEAALRIGKDVIGFVK